MFRDEELSELKDVIRNYDQAKLLYDEVKKSMSTVESQKTDAGVCRSFKSRKQVSRNRRRRCPRRREYGARAE